MTMQHHLVWENLSVELPTRRKLLTDLNGYAESGRIMAVMGPSGSGKSTLLDSLAGRLSANVKMNGKISIKGKKSLNSETFSYVTQEDFFLGTLTVKETITYSANLRLPQKMSKQEINNIIETTIVEMGLEDCANTIIGNWHLRGISGGEKRRLSIGVEILTQPDVLFLDEPTTGLDSAAAFFVVQSLGNIAYDGRIVVCAIHQPSSEVFNLFDDLLLLSSGETIYFGEAKLATQFFAEAGFPCPTRRNPSEHFLRCVCLDFDIVTDALLRSDKLSGIKESTEHILMFKTSEIRANLIQYYKNSEFSHNTKRRIKEILHNEDDTSTEFQNGSNFARWWKQLCTLTSRSFVNMYRDIGYYWLRMVFYVLVAISIGMLFFNLGKDSSQFVARQKLTGFIFGFMICLSNGGLPFFIEEMKVYGREINNAHYGEALLVLSNLLSSLPYLVVITLSSGTIIYWTVNLHPGFSHYAFFCLDLFCCLSIIEGIMMIVASLVPNVLMGIGVGTGVIVFMMMASEIFRRVPDTPKIFWQIPMSYLSFARWAMEGQLKNDMLGLEFDNLVPGEAKLKGEELLQSMFGMTVDQSKWLDLTFLFGLTLAHKLLFYVILKYKKKASSLFS